MSTIDSKLCSQDLCTGCFACKQVCNKGAIHITEVKGFSYPEIDPSLCVDCGLCTRACPIMTTKPADETEKEDHSVCYAVWNKDDKDRVNSSSGGVFSALADETLRRGGIVYGAGWDANMQLRHVGIDNVNKLDSLRRSKYVQSNTDGIYSDVKHRLQSGKQILFCGTPCQIGGLMSFLRYKDYPNLITVGVVCHGVPSQWSFDKYIREIEEKDNVKVVDCNFRSKEWGWCTGLNLSLYGKDKLNKDITINKITAENMYFNAFLKQYFLRESCYNCQFKGDSNLANTDIMLSDFWSLWAVIPWREIDWGKGVSAVVVNTEKGRAILKRCKDSLVVKERPYSEYASNTGLRNARKPKNNDEAFEFLVTNTWKETQSKFFPLKLSNKLPIYTRMLFGENLSILIKKIIKRITRR